MASVINDDIGPASLTASGPVTATSDGQVILGLDITAAGFPGIDANGYSITVEHCRIRHTGAAGISAEGVGKTIRIRNCDIAHSGQPTQGAGLSASEENIHIANSVYLEVGRTILAKGASGIWATTVGSAVISDVQGTDFRGPLPRGQFVQFDKCSKIRIVNCTTTNDPDTAYNEDIYSFYQCGDLFLSNCFADWCNAPNGQAFICEEAKGPHTILNAYAKRMWNGAFAAVDSNLVSFIACHSKGNVLANPSNYRSGSSVSNGLIMGSFPDESPPLPDATFGNKFIACTYESPGNARNIGFDTSSTRTDIYQVTQQTKAEPVFPALTWRWQS